MKIRLSTVRAYIKNYLLNESFRSYSNSASTSKEIYILSSVRTPIGLCKGVLKEFAAPQLASFAFKEALQRAVVPSRDIRNLFLGYFSHDNCNEEILKRTGLSKAVKISSDSMYVIENFMNGIKLFLTSNEAVCLAGGMVSMSNYIENKEGGRSASKNVLLEQSHLTGFVESNYKNFINASKNGAFQDEIAELMFRKKGAQILVTEDELSGSIVNFNNMSKEKLGAEYFLTPADGAIAFVIATEDYILKNHLMPIAKIVSFAEDSANLDFPSAQFHVIEKALKIGKCQKNQIAQWEIDSTCSHVYSAFINHFDINSALVNKGGGVLTSGCPIGLSGAKALCHLSHSLLFGELGCAASFNINGREFALIIKKFCGRLSTPPLLTLFTKKLCPLCDELKEQLKPFKGRFSLNEVNIEAEENKKYNELYKYEIPVLFLEGRFLCKHKLDAQHFNRRLLDFENFNC